jgi:ribosomal protein S18 acetylase RimI-like enzyme
MAATEQPAPSSAGPRPGSPQPLGAADVPVAARIVARAFVVEPSATLLFPDEGDRVRIAELKAAKLLRSATPLSTVYGVDIGDDLAGVAVWHPPGVTPGSLAATVAYAGGLVSQAPRVARMLPRAGALLGSDARALGRLLRERRRAARTASAGLTWYLAVLATDPAHQGRGVARALLDHVLARCDADGLGAWLETTDPVNPPIYERFGFATVALIEGGTRTPNLWVMRREPAPSG